MNDQVNALEMLHANTAARLQESFDFQGNPPGNETFVFPFWELLQGKVECSRIQPFRVMNPTTKSNESTMVRPLMPRWYEDSVPRRPPLRRGLFNHFLAAITSKHEKTTYIE